MEFMAITVRLLTVSNWPGKLCIEYKPIGTLYLLQIQYLAPVIVLYYCHNLIMKHWTFACQLFTIAVVSIKNATNITCTAFRSFPVSSYESDPVLLLVQSTCGFTLCKVMPVRYMFIHNLQVNWIPSVTSIWVAISCIDCPHLLVVLPITHLGGYLSWAITVTITNSTRGVEWDNVSRVWNTTLLY